MTEKAASPTALPPVVVWRDSGGSMKKIPLTQGKVALIDDDDYERISQFTWHAHRGSGSPDFYAKTALSRRTKLRTRLILMHRFIMGAAPGQQVDHVNRNTLDNRKSNLRLCNQALNSANSFGRTRRRSMYKGVTRRTDRKVPRWGAWASIKGKTIHLGTFTTEETAARAYDTSARLHYGAFARLNFPREGEQAVNSTPRYARKGAGGERR